MTDNTSGTRKNLPTNVLEYSYTILFVIHCLRNQQYLNAVVLNGTNLYIVLPYE